MSKLARLPIDDSVAHQVDKQIEKSVTDLLRDVTAEDAERLFLKKRLEDEIRTTLDRFARELSQASKQRQK